MALISMSTEKSLFIPGKEGRNVNKSLLHYPLCPKSLQEGSGQALQPGQSTPSLKWISRPYPTSTLKWLVLQYWRKVIQACSKRNELWQQKLTVVPKVPEARHQRTGATKDQ